MEAAPPPPEGGGFGNCVFRAMPITDSGPCRSPIPGHADLNCSTGPGQLNTSSIVILGTPYDGSGSYLASYDQSASLFHSSTWEMVVPTLFTGQGTWEASFAGP